MGDYSNKSILITGGTGSLGTALCNKLNKMNCKKVIILSRDWQKQVMLRESLGNPSNMRWFIGDVRDYDRLYTAFEMVDIVIHTAAIKCIETCENDPDEALKTNVIGTDNVKRACLNRGVNKAILISTDKAVNPLNYYGTTKAIAEKIFLNANVYRGWKKIAFSVVRYGNVIGSNGSVVKVWQKMIDEGATELPITDDQCTRYWYDINEAVDFVLSCIDTMKGGETFIPDDIPSIKITDLAKAFDKPYKIIGLRKGEKLHEQLDQDRSSDTNERFLTIEEIKRTLS